MFVTFYQNRSDKRALNKQLQIVGVPMTCNVKTPCDMLSPVITITKTSLAGWNRINYAYIDVFDRYYYMDAPTLETAGILEISLTVDPLMSNKASILGVNCMVLRSETLYNRMIVDDRAPVRSTRAIRYVPIGVIPTNNCYVITCDGGEVEGVNE